jgi:hypothetical protein
MVLVGMQSLRPCSVRLVVTGQSETAKDDGVNARVASSTFRYPKSYTIVGGRFDWSYAPKSIVCDAESVSALARRVGNTTCPKLA